MYTWSWKSNHKALLFPATRQPTCGSAGKLGPRPPGIPHVRLIVDLQRETRFVNGTGNRKAVVVDAADLAPRAFGAVQDDASGVFRLLGPSPSQQARTVEALAVVVFVVEFAQRGVVLPSLLSPCWVRKTPARVLPDVKTPTAR